MHEFSLAQELLKTAGVESRKAGIVRLDKIWVQVGDLSGISTESLEFAFGFLREEDEITKSAELIIEKVPGRGTCRQCGQNLELDRLYLYCPICQTPTVDITEGRDFIILRLEGED
jgi:hydrogenase nickel incorporation protein HypA/HybF